MTDKNTTSVLQPFTYGNKTKVIGYGFFCPGCRSFHTFRTYRNPTDQGPVWRFDDNLDKPTFSPSLLVYERKNPESGEVTVPRCHLFVKSGQIEFCRDSDHELAGQTVPMIPTDGFQSPDRKKKGSK